MSKANIPAPAPVFTPEQANAMTQISVTASHIEHGALVNVCALLVGEYVAPGILSTSGRTMAPHRRDAMAMLDKYMSDANRKRQFQRGEYLLNKYPSLARDAYEGATKGDDGQPMTGRVYATMIDALKGYGIATQYALDVAAELVKPRTEKPATPADPIAKAEAAASKAADKVATLKAEAAANTPGARALSIIATIKAAGLDKAARDLIFDCLVSLAETDGQNVAEAAPLAAAA